MAPTLSFLLLLLSSLTFTIGADPLFNLCEGGNYTADSPYSSNVNLLLTSLSSSSSKSSFSAQTKGSSGPDRTYGLFLCRGDVGTTDCSYCVRTAAKDVLNLCPNSRRATLWYDYCELRYSDVQLFGAADTANSEILINVESVSDKKKFIELENTLLDKVTSEAAYKSALLYATGTIKTGMKSMPIIYGLAQCTRDLSTSECGFCLQQIRDAYSGNLQERRGGRTLAKSCNFRYEVYTFYEGKPTITL